MATSVETSLPGTQTLTYSCMDAVKLLQKKTTTENNNTSKSLELIPFQKDGLNGFPVVFSPKHCSDVRLPASLYYHRNSDPLLHGQSKVRQEEEFGSCCQISREKRRQSDKGPSLNGPRGQVTDTNESASTYEYPTDCDNFKTDTLSGSDLLLHNSSYPDEAEPEVINIDLEPRVVCNGTLISSYQEDDDDGTSEKQPFLSHHSASGSESNFSAKHGVSWHKARQNDNGDFVDQSVSLPSSLERHSHAIHEPSVTDSETSLSVKPFNIWNKGRPLSGLSSRSISPQPGPSGYSAAKHKRDIGKKTVRYSDVIGSHQTLASGGSINSINTFPTTLSEEHMNRLDREIREIERVGKKADRGTIYCACGVLGLVIGLILVFVYIL